MYRSIIAICILLIVVAGCRKDEQFIMDGYTRVNECSSVDPIKKVNICFDSVVNESRCPPDVTCIWAGYVIIKVSLHENGRSHVFNMMHPRYPNLEHLLHATNDTTINGYKIALDAVGGGAYSKHKDKRYQAKFTITQ